MNNLPGVYPVIPTNWRDHKNSTRTPDATERYMQRNKHLFGKGKKITKVERRNE